MGAGKGEDDDENVLFTAQNECAFGNSGRASMKKFKAWA
jgi:hypothetical protein